MRLFICALLITAASLTGSAAHATCDHPYWALSKGVTRHYKSSNGHEQNWKVEKVGEGKATVVITWIDDKGRSAKESRMEVECNDQGISLDFTKLAESREGMQVRVVKRRGAFLPPASKLKAGSTWDTTAVIEMASPGTAEPVTAEIKASHKVEGTESVTVPAGAFQALKITAHNEMTIQIPEVGSPRAATIPGMMTHTTSTYWLVKGLGMVKAESKAEMGDVSGSGMGAGGGVTAMSKTTTTELTEYSR